MFKVQKHRCSTCIYRKDMLWDLKRLEDECRDPHIGFNGYRTCHHDRSNEVCCKGFWDHHKDEFQLGQVAQRLDLVQYVEVDDLRMKPLPTKINQEHKC